MLYLYKRNYFLFLKFFRNLKTEIKSFSLFLIFIHILYLYYKITYDMIRAFLRIYKINFFT